jgi:hypothetical protein
MPLRLLTALAALAVVLTVSAPAGAGRRVCGVAGYSYAGYLSPTPAYGISGSLALTTSPKVDGGHVAAWIGVGGSGMGPGGSDAWVQAGISGFPDGHSELYYEFQLPTQKQPQYVSLGRATPGKSYDLAVYEPPSRQNAWRVTLNGERVSPAIVLPGSHGAWRPIATSESWDGGSPACNRFGYDFSNLATATRYGSGWQPFTLSRAIQDPGYRVLPRVSGFAASAAA